MDKKCFLSQKVTVLRTVINFPRRGGVSNDFFAGGGYTA